MLTSAIPNDGEALLTRRQVAAALTEAGYPVAVSTLSTMATRGGSPPFHRFGRRILYRWGAALKWAEARLSGPASSTAEHQRTAPDPRRSSGPHSTI
jgi:hypothetical protein